LRSPRQRRLGGAWQWLEKPLGAAWPWQIFFGLGAAWPWQIFLVLVLLGRGLLMLALFGLGAVKKG
jgi:hypothetical protein